MVLKLLDNTHKKTLEELFKFYKHFYICNKCGSLYGSDYFEKEIFCPKCEILMRKEDK